jgi:hypothetical protein
MWKRIFAFTLIINSLAGYSQQSELGNWLNFTGNKKLGSRFDLHHEVQYRNYNAVGDLEQLLLRAGIGYNLTENNNNILAGYAFIHGQNYTGAGTSTFVNEHRIFQQFIMRSKAARVGVMHRYRFEQRFIEDDFRMRFRYLLALTIPLNKKEMIENTLYLSASNEVFLNSKTTVFDRDRLYGGLGYKFSDRLRVELGYLNQFLNSSQRDQVNVILLLNY